MHTVELLAEGIDFTPLLNVLKDNQHLWDAIPARTGFPESPHREVHDIILRYPDIEDVTVINERCCTNYPAMEVFRRTLYPYLAELMSSVGAIGVGRVMFTLLEPGKQVYPHEDQGAACDFFHRFHLVLQGGGVLKVGEHEVVQNTGDVMWFNNSMEHSVINNTDQQRIVLIVDLELLNVVE